MVLDLGPNWSWIGTEPTLPYWFFGWFESISILYLFFKMTLMHLIASHVILLVLCYKNQGIWLVSSIYKFTLQIYPIVTGWYFSQCKRDLTPRNNAMRYSAICSTNVVYNVFRYVPVLDIQNLYCMFRCVLLLKSDLPGLLSWGLGAAQDRNLPGYDKWYQSKSRSMLSNADLQDAIAFGSWSITIQSLGSMGDLFVRNV